MPYAYAQHESLLATFESTFSGHPYLHRNQNLGNAIGARIYYDLREIAASSAYAANLSSGQFGLNRDTRIAGRDARRGDGAFGRFIPGQTISPHPTIASETRPLLRAPIAQVQIGVESKILAKAMTKQLSRVCTDLSTQVLEFRETGGNPICVALIGVNNAPSYVSFEGSRSWPTTGRGGFLHPLQEAATVTQRIRERVRDYDEILFLQFCATNEDPYAFQWVNFQRTRLEYGALLTRVSLSYQQRNAQ